jgi:hypothetical protein
MVNIVSLILGGVALLSPVLGQTGAGITTYDPLCAHACRAVIASAVLDCGTSSDTSGMGASAPAMVRRQSLGPPISPVCRAASKPFLTTLAYCINSTCPSDTPAWVLERYWLAEATGAPGLPSMWTYDQSLMMVTAPPTTTYVFGGPLMETQLLASGALALQSATLQNAADGESTHARHA